MARKPSTVEYSRFSYCVPTDDVDVINWIAVQHNLSMSLRALIKNEVQKNGLCDIFCKPITNPGISPGRPKSVAVAQMEPQMQQVQQTQPTQPIQQVQMQPVVTAQAPVMQTPVQQVVQMPQMETPVQPVQQIPVSTSQQSSASAMVAADPRLAGLL